MINFKLLANPLNWLIVGSMAFIGFVGYGIVRGNRPSGEET